MAPKKKQRTDPTTVASTSTTAPPTRNLLSNNQSAKDRKKRFQKLEFDTTQYIDWGLLNQYDVRDRTEAMIQEQAWLRLFDLREPAYKNLTIEVLSTLDYIPNRENSTFVFQAYGERHELVIKSIGSVMGLYDTADQHRDLPNGWPQEATAESFWTQITRPHEEPFISSKSLASAFVQVEHKLLHHILVHTLSCKKTSHSKVTSFDLFYMYSIIRSYSIDIGVEVASYMFRQADDPRTKSLCCGGYITRILKGMGIFREPEGDMIFTSKGISPGPFRSWGLVKTSGAARAARAQQQQQQEEVGFQDIFPGDIPIEFPTFSAPPPPSTSVPGPSTSGYDMNELHLDIQQLQRDNEDLRNRLRAQERLSAQRERKHKRSMHKLFDALKAAMCCINPEAGEAMRFESSPEEPIEEQPEEQIQEDSSSRTPTI